MTIVSSTRPVTGGVMAAHDVNFADAHAEMVGHELADGNIGLVVDWSGYDADDETASSIPAHLVAASAGDHSYLETLVVYAHEPRSYGPGPIPASTSAAWRSVRSGEQQGGRVARHGKFVIKQGRGAKTRFVLLASNGRVVVTSETYGSRQSCLKGIDAVKRLAADATVVEDAVAAAPAASKRATGRTTPASAK